MAREVLPRFELTVLRNKTESDNTQVPADGASINFYRQGATVQTTATIQVGSYGGTIAVLCAGQVEAGDVLRVGTTTDRLTVVQVASATQLLVRWAGSSSYTVLQGTRLWIVNGRPVAFADSAGTMAIASSIPVESGTGFATAYLSADRFDFEVLIPGQATRYYLDQAAGFGRSDQRWNDIRDFGGSIQAALDALPPTGGVVFVPRGTWVLSAGVAIAKPNVSITGERALSVIRPASANVIDLLTITGARCRLRDLVLDGVDTAYRTNGKSCAVVSAQATSFERVVVRKAPRHGVWIKDA
jgi:hypothetical protein